MKLIVGLGNPGRSYAASRHNIGFMCISHFAKEHGIRFDRKQGKARTGVGEIAGEPVVLARPQTFMNRSGESVAALVKRFKIALSDLIIIHDDLDLPLGRIRLSFGAGSGGHKGIDSIIDYLDSGDFSRLRVGVGRPPEATEAAIIDYVLGDFTPEEGQVMKLVIPRVSDALLDLLTDGLAVAMNKYN